MKRYLVPAIVSACALVATSCFADDNLILNGSFDSWNGGVPAEWATNDPSHLTKISGVEGADVALVMENADLRQAVLGSPKNYTIKFRFTVNRSPDVGAFSQSLVFNIYQTSDLVASGEAWISLRFQTGKASALPFSLAAFGGVEWHDLTDPIFKPSVLTDDKTGFDSASVYEMVISYEALADKYTIQYGLRGGEKKKIGPLAFYRHPSEKTGLRGLQFYSNDNGFTLGDVTVSKDR